MMSGRVAFIIEMMDPLMEQVLRRKTGWERLAIVDRLNEGARQLVEANIRGRNPDWTNAQVRQAVAWRIGHDQH